MNYPIWDIPSFGTGLLMALVAVIHVYVSHFAIGGGLFLVLTEAKGHRENNRGILDYVHRHAKLFLLISMVFGAITGVGIWFTITVINPSATSTLIHSFVFGWATEWVFFAVEILSLFAYVYTFGKLDPKKHMILGWMYFAFAWLSLFVINGIVAFMLTPGGWSDDHSFWSGFFNPTMWPSLVFRSLLCFMIAGLFGFLTSTRIKDSALSLKMTRYCARWLIIPLILMPAAGYWYLSSVPEGPRGMIMGDSPEMSPFVRALAVAVPVLLLGGAFMAVRAASFIKKPLAFVLLIVGLLYMGSFEWIREAARRPWVIPGHTYSNGIKPEQIPAMNKSGFLANSKWAVSDPAIDRAQAGVELFRGQCQACHTIGGINNDILDQTLGFNKSMMEAKLQALGVLDPYMPPFVGTKLEREVLAEYIVEKLQNQTATSALHKEQSPLTLPTAPGFDAQKNEYVLFAWRGQHGDIEQQLIKRAESPEIVEDDVEFKHNEVKNSGGFSLVRALLKDSSEPIAQTLVPPQRDDFACGNCHSDLATDPLRAHEQKVGVSIKENKGCKKCHENLSASVHGLHGIMLRDQGAEACAQCHQTSNNAAPMLRGHHVDAGLDCTSCHGVMEDHAIALLNGLKENSPTKQLLSKLSSVNFERADQIKARKPWVQQPDCLNCHVEFKSPDTDQTFGKWTKDETELFSAKTDDAGVKCAACHGDAHATYPATHAWDELQPKRLQGNHGPIASDQKCAACHTTRMEDSVHHEGVTPPPPITTKTDMDSIK